MKSNTKLFIMLIVLAAGCLAQREIPPHEVFSEEEALMSEEEITEFEKTIAEHTIDFRRFDKNKDHKLSFNEILNTVPELTKADVRIYFKEFDLDNNGQICLKEYLKACMVANMQIEDIPNRAFNAPTDISDSEPW